uniref:Uncharacterized protein n=1 Tax=Panagrolaimus sp. ES5 TaxID=591445 RepID=A0AC34EZZ3_9BILA
MIQQLMTMDIDLYQFNESNNKLDYEWHRDLWISKKWKTIVKTRLCDDCKKWFKMEAKKVVETHTKKVEKVKENSGTVKRKEIDDEKRRKKVRVHDGYEEDSDEESEDVENVFESEDSILSDEDNNSDMEKEINHEEQPIENTSLTIGSTLAWSPLNHLQYEQGYVFPSINTIFRHPQNSVEDQSIQTSISQHTTSQDNSLYNTS